MRKSHSSIHLQLMLSHAMRKSLQSCNFDGNRPALPLPELPYLCRINRQVFKRHQGNSFSASCLRHALTAYWPQTFPIAVHKTMRQATATKPCPFSNLTGAVSSFVGVWFNACPVIRI